MDRVSEKILALIEEEDDDLFEQYPNLILKTGKYSIDNSLYFFLRSKNIKNYIAKESEIIQNDGIFINCAKYILNLMCFVELVCFPFEINARKKLTSIFLYTDGRYEGQLYSIDDFIRLMSSASSNFQVLICHQDEFENIDVKYKNLIDKDRKISQYYFTEPYNLDQLIEILAGTIKFKYVTLIRNISVDENVMKTCTNAFVYDLDGIVSNLAELNDAIKFLADMETGKIAVRYMHLVQSSGYGKTKHGIEAIQSYKQGLYFVKRQSRSTGFPPQPGWITILFIRMVTAKSNEECEFFWLSMIKLALETFNRDKMKDINMVKLFSNHYEKILADFSNQIENHEQYTGMGCNAMVHYIKILCQDLGITDATTIFPIIFDEASELMESPNPDCFPYYRNLLRALRRLSGMKGIVSIFMGTSSFMRDYRAF